MTRYNHGGDEPAAATVRWTAEHRETLCRRGYSEVSQIFKNKAVGFRTYWSAIDEKGMRVFCKVTYGTNARTEIAKKEVFLSKYISERLEGISGVQVPEPCDFWEDSHSTFICFQWFEFAAVGFFSVLERKDLFGVWCNMMEKLRGVPAPSESKVGMFQWIDYLADLGGQQNGLSPFGIDSWNNVAVTGFGLVVFDFEHLQWSDDGLNEAFVAINVLSQSPSQLFRAILGVGPLIVWWRSLAMTAQSIEKASAVLRRHLERRGSLGFRKKLITSIAAIVLARKVGRFWI